MHSLVRGSLMILWWSSTLADRQLLCHQIEDVLAGCPDLLLLPGYQRFLTYAQRILAKLTGSHSSEPKGSHCPVPSPRGSWTPPTPVLPLRRSLRPPTACASERVDASTSCVGNLRGGEVVPDPAAVPCEPLSPAVAEAPAEVPLPAVAAA